MILSASRRTDIPNYYSEWFINRIKEGYLCVRNPMYPEKVSRIAITPDVVDCIVFWTKNPTNMLNKLSELDGYHYYFQFTLTGYGKDVEAALPNKKEVMIPTFQKLSQIIGASRVVWRYDPIFFSPRYTKEYHLRAFESIASELKGCTEKCVISFLDVYPKIKERMKNIGMYELFGIDLNDFAAELSRIAASNGIKVATCSEKIDLSFCNIEHNACIDRELIERVCGYSLKGRKDKAQRGECGCMESIDIGMYDTCSNGCIYCYANNGSLNHNHNPLSPFLVGENQPTDIVTDKEVVSLRV